MNKRITTVTTALVVLIALAVPVLAQQQRAADPRAQMREKYRYTFELMRMVRHIQEIDKDKKYTLTPDQAKKVLAVLKPYRTKPKMTQEQAKQVLKSLKPIFTAAQLKAMENVKPSLQRRPSPPPGDRDKERPSGPPPAAGQRRFDPDAMKDFNPFYSKAPKGDKWAEERVKRMNEFFASLEKKAKTK